ncbi:MAG: hypothetical protein ACKVWV_11550 [Planctomycetota bacterium]
MFASLALAPLALSGFAALTPGDRAAAPRGTLVLQDEPSALDAATCRSLASGDGTHERLWIVLPGASTAVDPLSACPARVTRMDIEEGASRRGDDHDLAARAHAAREIVLSRGTYLGWWRFLGRAGATSRVGRALEEAQRKGKVICAQGAAAAYLAQWTPVEHADILRVSRNPRDAGDPFVVNGFALLTDTLIDTSTRTRGEIEPLLVALARGSIVDAIHLDGPVSWIRGEHGDRVVGHGRVIQLALGRARTMRGELREARVTLLGSAPQRGDRSVAAGDGEALTAAEFAARIDALCDGRATTDSLARARLRVTLWIDEASRRDVRDGIGIDVLRARE